MNYFSKKFSDFKQKSCKKIAELTEVVHVLFVQNQEKDEIINILRNEFSNLEYNLEAQIHVLKSEAKQNQISDQEKQYLIVQLKQNFCEEEGEIRKHYNEISKILKDQLTESLNEQQKLKSNLENLKKQYDEMSLNKNNIETESNSRIKDLESKLKESNNMYMNMESSYTHVIQERQIMKNESRAKVEKISNENMQLTKSNEHLIDANRTLKNKCKELEMQINVLNEQIKRNKSAISNIDYSTTNNEKRKNNGIDALSNGQKHAAAVFDMTRDEQTRKSGNCQSELERELLRYKMELSNRDKNFNSLFGYSNLRVQPSRGVTRRFSEMTNQEFDVKIDKSTKYNSTKALLNVVSAQYREKETQLPNISK